MTISDNTQLASLDNIRFLNLVQESITISANDALNFTSPCHSSGGVVDNPSLFILVTQNPVMTHLRCFAGIGTLNALDVVENVMLTHVEVLGDATSVSTLTFTDNTVLASLSDGRSSGLPTLASVSSFVISNPSILTSARLLANVAVTSSLSSISGGGITFLDLPELFFSTSTHGALTFTNSASLFVIDISEATLTGGAFTARNLSSVRTIKFPISVSSSNDVTISNCALLADIGWSSASVGALTLGSLPLITHFGSLTTLELAGTIRLTDLVLTDVASTDDLASIPAMFIDRCFFNLPPFRRNNIGSMDAYIPNIQSMTVWKSSWELAPELGELVIANCSSLLDFSGPGTSTSIGALVVSNNPSLVTFVGPDTVESLSRVVFRSNPALTTVAGFGHAGLTLVDSLTFDSNVAFVSAFSAFPNVLSLTECYIVYNPLLECLGCPGHVSATGLAGVGDMDYFHVVGNPRLQRVPFAAVTVQETLYIINNTALTSLAGLAPMTNTQGIVVIEGNQNLLSVSLPNFVTSNGVFVIRSNPSLKSLSFPVLDTGGSTFMSSYASSLSTIGFSCLDELVSTRCADVIVSTAMPAFTVSSECRFFRYKTFETAWTSSMSSQAMTIIGTIPAAVNTPNLDCVSPGGFYITNNPLLGVESTSVLQAMSFPATSMLPALWVGGNRVLRDVTGWEALQTANIEIAVMNNPSLGSVGQLLGVTAVRIVRFANNPVLCVRNESVWQGLATVSYTSTGNANASSPVCDLVSLENLPAVVSPSTALDVLASVSEFANSTAWTSPTTSASAQLFITETMYDYIANVIAWVQDGGLQPEDFVVSNETIAFFDSAFTPSGAPALGDLGQGDDYVDLLAEYLQWFANELDCGVVSSLDLENVDTVAGNKVAADLPGVYTAGGSSLAIPGVIGSFLEPDNCVEFSVVTTVHNPFPSVVTAGTSNEGLSGEIDSGVVTADVQTLSGSGSVSGLSMDAPFVVRIKRSGLSSVVNVTCVFWNATMSAWSGRGCRLNTAQSTTSLAVCECTHLTSFAVLVDVTGTSTTATVSGAAATALEVLT